MIFRIYNSLVHTKIQIQKKKQAADQEKLSDSKAQLIKSGGVTGLLNPS